MGFSTSLIRALGLTTMAFAQVSTPCNPTIVSNCPADRALSSSFRESFQQESKYFSPIQQNDDRIKYIDEGAAISLNKRFDNPTLKSNFYIMFGRLEVLLRAAPGRGIVSSFCLLSDDLDEIDLEWIGGDNNRVQSNYFSKGDTSSYNRGAFHDVHDSQQAYHNYTIDWTKDSLNWYVDGALVRTLTSDSPLGYPESPMYVVMGIWAGGDPSNQPGVIEWAGGLSDYTQVPFTMYVKSVIVCDYSSGSEYKYSDKSGKWTSIEAVNGKINGREQQAQQEFAILAAGGDDKDFQPDEKSSQTSSHSVSSSTKAPAHEPLSSVEVSSPEISSAEVSSAEVSSPGVSPPETSSPKVSPPKVSSNLGISSTTKKDISPISIASPSILISKFDPEKSFQQNVTPSSSSSSANASSSSATLPSLLPANSGHSIIPAVGKQGFKTLLNCIFITSLIILA